MNADSITHSLEALGDNPSEDEIAAHLQRCEESLLDPAARKNRAHVADLLAGDFQEFGSSGRVWTREQILDLLESEEPQQLAMENLVCHLIARGAALITYLAVRSDAETNEQTRTLRSSLWTEESGKWRMRFHQGTRSM